MKKVTKVCCIIFSIIVVISSLVKCGLAIDSETQKETVDDIFWYNAKIEDMFTDLNENALKASEKYKNYYFNIVGYISTIDADGKYIAISYEQDNYQNILCYIKDDSIKKAILNYKVNDQINLGIKVTDVDETFGFWSDIIRINN